MKKITAIILVTVLMFSAVLTPVAASEEQTVSADETQVMSVADYRLMLEERSYPAITTDQ